MYKNLQYNRSWTFYLLFYNPNGTISSKMKRNRSAFQDFLPHTFFGSKMALFILTSDNRSAVILFTFIADGICIDLKIVFQNALLNSSTRCRVVLNQQLPLTFYNPHESKLDLYSSQTLQKALVSLFLSFLSFLHLSSNEFKCFKYFN